MEILHKSVPKKKLGSWSDAPWMTTDLKRLLRKKKRLYNNCKKSNNQGEKQKYRQFQKHLNEFIWNQIKNFVSPFNFFNAWIFGGWGQLRLQRLRGSRM